MKRTAIAIIGAAGIAATGAGCGTAAATHHAAAHPPATHAPAQNNNNNNAAPASPSPAPTRTLLTLSGSGIQNSAPFNVGSAPLTVTYTFNCSAFGMQGNFVADIISTASPTSGNYDDESVANQLSTGGSSTTTVYPTNPGTNYYLSVNSECSWTVTVTGN